MELGMIGLGRMGANMVRRLLRAGHRCVVFDQSPDQVQRLVEAGAVGSRLARRFRGETGQAPRSMDDGAGRGCDRANGHRTGRADGRGRHHHRRRQLLFQRRRAPRQALRPKGIDYLDVGTSGGVWGVERGYCLMIGGRRETVDRLDPIFKSLAPGRGDIPRTPGREKLHGTAEEGYLYCGPAGAGHFVKMVHNGIEYGLMQSYAEGFDILRGVGGQELPEDAAIDLELADVAEVWRRGSVIGSWLLDLTAMALAENPTLSNFTGSVQDSGEGRWTVEAAIEEAVPAEVLTSALYTRFRSPRSMPSRRRCCRRCVTSSEAIRSVPRVDSQAHKRRTTDDDPTCGTQRRGTPSGGGRPAGEELETLGGIIPLLAVEVLKDETIDRLPGFRKRLRWFLNNRRDLADQVSYLEPQGPHGQGRRLLAIPSRPRLERMLRYLLDEGEFLSAFGIRSLSRIHKDRPYVCSAGGGEHRVDYEPGESTSALLGGNSNWRGPIWFPLELFAHRGSGAISSLLRRYAPRGMPHRLGPNDESPGSGPRISLAADAQLFRPDSRAGGLATVRTRASPTTPTGGISCFFTSIFTASRPRARRQPSHRLDRAGDPIVGRLLGPNRCTATSSRPGGPLLLLDQPDVAEPHGVVVILEAERSPLAPQAKPRLFVVVLISVAS